MEHVATLVAAPGFDGLGDIVARLSRSAGATVWLEEGRAADLAFEDWAPADIAEVLAETIGEAPLDHAVQPAFGRRKHLLIADMDSTFITVECIDVIARHAGIGAEIAEITRRTIRGELDFSDSLRARVARLAGASVELFETAWREDVGFMPGGPTLLATMRARGALTALVSGGFTWFTERVAAAVGFDTHRANTLDIGEGLLAGTMTEPILDRGAKLDILRELAASRRLSLAETMAVGDGANDIAMLEAAGMGIAYHGVAAAERAADAAVRHGDLTTLLFFQGYRRADFVSADVRL